MLRAFALGFILIFGLCGCATQSKKAQETIFEVSFYSEAEHAAPFISLRGDRKLFVLRVRQARQNYNYDGKFYELTRGEESDLKAKAMAFFKSVSRIWQSPASRRRSGATLVSRTWLSNFRSI